MGLCSSKQAPEEPVLTKAEGEAPKQPAEPIAAIVKRHKAQLQEAEARLGGTDKYAMIRAAQVKRCTQLLAILDRFGG